MKSSREIATTRRRWKRSSRQWRPVTGRGSGSGCSRRGMVSEEKIEFLKAGGRQYLVGTPKSQLQRFDEQLLSQDWHAIRDGLEVKLCQDPEGGEETFLLCRSRDRREKEQAMHARFEKRIEDGLTKLAATCAKRLQQPAIIKPR